MNKCTKKFKKYLCGVLMSFSVLNTTLASEHKNITLGVTDLSFHRVTGSLLYHILSDMGFDVKRVYAPHVENFNSLKLGEIDMLNSAWLPSSHGVYLADVEAVIPLIQLGLHYKPYALWGVPDYIPEKDVSKISDLLKPEVKERMIKDIQGINPGAGITRFSIKMMDAYGLKSAGYRFHTGSEDDSFGAFERAVESEQWVVVPLWKPQFLHSKHDIRELVEPKGLLGGVDEAVLLLREDRKNNFTKKQLKQLDEIRFSNEIIANLDYQVSKQGESLDEVTRKWIDSFYYQ